MIAAWRIPMLTEQVRQATIEAAEQQRAAVASDLRARDDASEHDLVRRLERLGYKVTLERIAA